MDNLTYLVSLTVSEFRAIKRAISTLTRAGVSSDNAVCIIVTAHRENRESRSRYRAA